MATDKRLEREQRMYDTLQKIAKGYMTPAQIRRRAERDDSPLEYEEHLEMAYENIQAEAKAAVRGMRRPAASKE